jgi:YHS domain-containing protein
MTTQESNSVTKDPICGMTMDEATALQAERDGKRFYFCSEHCRHKFLSTSTGAKTEDKSAPTPVSSSSGTLIMMHNVKEGVRAGLVATAVLSMLMVMKSAMGLMPSLDIISMLSGLMDCGPVMGWIADFMIGAFILGGIFALLEPTLPGGKLWLKGVLFGVGAWLAMMLAVMPMAGTGFFGMNLGMVAPVMTLVLHVIYGAVLGGVYAALQSRDRDTNTPIGWRKRSPQLHSRTN